MDDVKLEQDGGSSFAAYFEEGDIEDTITVHEDGRIDITGVMTGEQAINLLMEAARRVRLFIERRSLPSMIEPLPADDPAGRFDPCAIEFDELPSPPVDTEKFKPLIDDNDIPF